MEKMKLRYSERGQQTQGESGMIFIWMYYKVNILYVEKRPVAQVIWDQMLCRDIFICIKVPSFILDTIMATSSLRNWIADFMFLHTLSKKYIDDVSWCAGSYCVTPLYDDMI